MTKKTDKIIVFPRTPWIPLIIPMNIKKDETSMDNNKTFLSLDISSLTIYSAPGEDDLIRIMNATDISGTNKNIKKNWTKIMFSATIPVNPDITDVSIIKNIVPRTNAVK